MPRYSQEEKEYRVGDYWLSKQSRSPAWCRTWYDQQSQQTKRSSLRTTDFEEAKQKLNDWFILENQRVSEATDAVTIASIFARYFENHGQHLKSSALVEIALRYWLDFYGDKSLSETANVREQERFHNWLIHQKGLKPNSAARIVSNGKTAINWAWKRGEIDHVPYFLPIKNIGVVPPRGRPIDLTEIASLIRAATRPHLVDFIILMLATASRPDAILELTFDRCDFENGLIILNAPDRPQTKKHRPIVKMPDQVRTYLELLKAQSSCEHVISFRGRPVKNLKTVWKTSRAKADLDDQVNPYSLRHTIARHLRRQSVPAWEVAAQLGHKVRGASTTEIYAPFDPTYLSQSKQAIDALFCQLSCEFRVKDVSELISISR